MKSYVYAVAYIILFLLIAHLIVGEPYLWYRNSISQLAAQAYQYAWIMRLGFIGFGVIVQIVGIVRMMSARPYSYREVPIMLYGLAILLSGIFSTSPFIKGITYSEQEARIHSFFATSAGVALTVGVLLYALTDTARRAGHLIALVLITGVSFLLGAVPTIGGVTQRLLWLVGFAWLVYLGPSPFAARREKETILST